MEQMRVKTVSFQLERPKVFHCRRKKSFFRRKKRLPTSKFEKRECKEVRTEGKRETQPSTDERNINKQSPKFHSGRRFAICSVMEEEGHCYRLSLEEEGHCYRMSLEEEGHCYRMSLAESRRNLVIVHSLIDSGLL